MVVELLRQLDDWVVYKLMGSSCRRQLASVGAPGLELGPACSSLQARTPRRYPPVK